MRRNSSSLGAFHPILFFLCVYGISLFLAIFVCRTVYNSLNDNASAGLMLEMEDNSQPLANATAYK
jgi:flagellar biosynthesis protein FliP